MEEPWEMEEPVVIQTFNPVSGDYYACWNCRTHIALHQHLLPYQPGMQIDDRAFSEAINVYTNSPAEDHIDLHHNCTRTSVYCITCNQILGFKFIQVAGGYERPIVGEFVFARVGNFDANRGDYYACWNCSSPVALQFHSLPISPDTSKSGYKFVGILINVYTNSPAEDQISLLHNVSVTSTNVYCNSCNLILGFEFIQVAEDNERPIVGEVIFDRPRLILIRIAVDSDVDSLDDMD